MSLILGIESSCDETAAALVTSEREILAHKLAGQEAEHAPYGGVVPEIAARAHAEILTPLIAAALDEAGKRLEDVDAIAATGGPGLIGGVMVEGHALSPRLVNPDLAFPYLLLLVSGGHCQILRVEGVGQYRRLATTIDDAAGEAFDKTAKILGLGYPGGPKIESFAKQGDPVAVPLPRPLTKSAEPHFSFAGLKSAVVRAHESNVHKPEDIAASFQQAVVDCLRDRLEKAIHDHGRCAHLVVAGGVAANGPIRAMLEQVAKGHDMAFTAPPNWLCTDNAAMIAWAGAERFAAGLTDSLDFVARPRWPLDPTAEKARGAGVKA